MIIAAIIFLLYILGAIVFYVLDGLFDWFYYSDERIMSTFLWPISMWLVLAFQLRRLAERARKKREEQE